MLIDALKGLIRVSPVIFTVYGASLALLEAKVEGQLVKLGSPVKNGFACFTTFNNHAILFKHMDISLMITSSILNLSAMLPKMMLPRRLPT